jgi:putative PIG3 family NAD(P)H quinone oxidoreductase
MRAVAPWTPGSPARARLVDLPDPEPGPGGVLVEVAATALNRADLLQLRGNYPPPAGASPIPGLEASGTVRELGAGTTGWRPGDRAMALLAGGGHAERVAVPAEHLLPIPDALSLDEGAAVPEAGITSWTNLVVEGGLAAGEWVAISGAASGVGTFAVQLVRELGARSIVLGRRPDRLERLRDLGADAVVPLDEQLAEGIRAATGGKGADLVLDLVGGPWLPKLLAALAPRGRCVLVGLLAGRSAELDLGSLLKNRLHLKGSVLRTRSREEKAALVRAFGEFALPRLADGRLRPVIDRILAFEEIARAYETLERSEALGKVVVRLATGPARSR